MENNPIERFQAVFERAKQSGIELPESTCLATVRSDGHPAARVVLLKEVGERGFVFYTNMQSDKALELEQNPQAALCFYWSTIGEQVRVEGKVTIVDDDEADAYFASRDRESQIGAWASDQSRELDAPETLRERFKELEAQYAGVDEIPRPPHWSGYLLVADRIEFWKNQPHRLHNRFLYEREGDGWKAVMLYP